MKVFSPRMRRAALLGALLLLAGFPESSVASRIPVRSFSDVEVNSSYPGGSEKQVYRLHGPLAKSKGG
jgi:hypothetical protein